VDEGRLEVGDALGEEPGVRLGLRAGGSGLGVLIIFGVLVLIGFWPAMVWHGYTDTGGYRWDIHSTIACLTYWGILAALVGLGVLVSWGNKREAAKEKAAPLPPPICTHGNAVRVDSVLDKDKTVAWWCPDCETQLDPGWQPAPTGPGPAVNAAAAPAGRWSWRWWCTCGRSRSGYAPTELAAQAAIDRGVTAHQRPGHRWQRHE